jgi:hypothetical protein
MSLGYYFHPASMSTQQYDEIMKRLDAAGAGKPKGRSFHSAFSEGESVAVYDVWDSEADFEAFGKTLMPILAEIGVDPGQPSVVPMHNVLFG